MCEVGWGGSGKKSRSKLNSYQYLTYLNHGPRQRASECYTSYYTDKSAGTLTDGDACTGSPRPLRHPPGHIDRIKQTLPARGCQGS